MTVLNSADYTYCGKHGDYYVFRDGDDNLSLLRELKYFMSDAKLVVFFNRLGISLGRASRNRLREEEADAVLRKFEQSKIQL